MFGYTEKYLTKNGRPWFPIMGEMHYSRYNEHLWKESLQKMKAGGVNIVSSYVIWIHHEEEENVFDFSGCRDLAKYIRLCKELGIYLFLRLGPWVHGEVRNGGFPDWLQKKENSIALRTDDSEYLAYVRRFWEQAFAHVKGNLYKDGGPVIGVQIENEYGHVGGQTGEAGEMHMRTLSAMAKDIGFDVPLYTATGWGGAVTGGLLPVMGGYCEAPWAQTTEELAANANFVFSEIRNDALIASDHHVGDDITYDPALFPYLTAELGGGLQVTKHRRPVATGKDIGAMSLVKLGSGAAMLGYYMYHGGSNPEGKLTTLQESTKAGDLNDLPEINYDFNAPIRQYGTISESYREIRMLGCFLNDFGMDLAALSPEIEPANVDPEDMSTLRLSCRHDDTHGYVFFNNYQRRRVMEPHIGVQLRGKCAKGDVIFPKLDIASGQYGFFPYNMNLDGAILKSALATPLCRLGTEGDAVFVFYGDWEPQLVWEGEKKARILHISREDAGFASKLLLDREYLIVTEGNAWEEDGKLAVSGGPVTLIKSFPELSVIPDGFVPIGKERELWAYERRIDEPASIVELCCVSNTGATAEYCLTIKYNGGKRERKEGRDTILVIDYAGESMEIFLDGKKINDYFYTGQKAVLSLGYFDFPSKLTAVVYELREKDDIYLEVWPEMPNGRACRISEVSLQEEYR